MFCAERPNVFRKSNNAGNRKIFVALLQNFLNESCFDYFKEGIKEGIVKRVSKGFHLGLCEGFSFGICFLEGFLTVIQRAFSVLI